MRQFLTSILPSTLNLWFLTETSTTYNSPPVHFRAFRQLFGQAAMSGREMKTFQQGNFNNDIREPWGLISVGVGLLTLQYLLAHLEIITSFPDHCWLFTFLAEYNPGIKYNHTLSTTIRGQTVKTSSLWRVALLLEVVSHRQMRSDLNLFFHLFKEIFFAY